MNEIIVEEVKKEVKEEVREEVKKDKSNVNLVVNTLTIVAGIALAGLLVYRECKGQQGFPDVIETGKELLNKIKG